MRETFSFLKAYHIVEKGNMDEQKIRTSHITRSYLFTNFTTIIIYLLYP
jgi:hypothetical protein